MQNNQLIKNFDFNGFGVRVITNAQDQVFFVAKDVCDVLGYSKASSTIVQTHCKKEGVTKMVIPSDGGNQEQFLINEGNLYRLVLKSKKKEAEKFESWVCDEVLPAIRKTGRYETKALTPAEQLLANAQLLVDIERKQIEAERKQLEFDNRLLLIEAKTATRPEYFTIMGFAILKGVKVGLSLAGQLGKRAKELCIKRGYFVDKVNDPRFGYVGSYPKEVLEEVFA